MENGATKRKYFIKNKYRLINTLGAGPHGEVYLVEKTIGEGRDAIFAAKVMTLDSARHPEAILEAWREKLSRIREIDSDYIARIKEVGIDSDDKENVFCVITEYMSGGSLAERLDLRFEDGRLKSEIIPGRELKDLLIQICQGLKDIHGVKGAGAAAKGFAHGNLKPQNVLLSDEGRVKLSDVFLPGCSPNPPDPAEYPEIALSGVWSSPEQVKIGDSEPKPDVDFWALGLMMRQMMGGEHAFDGDAADAILASMAASEESPEKIEYLPKNLEALLERCLQRDPLQRHPGIGSLIRDIKDQEFLKNCANGHLNEYFHTFCSLDECDAGFGPSPGDLLWNDSGNWCQHTRTPESMGPGDEKSITLKLFPRQHPDSPRAIAEGRGCDVQVRFDMADQPLVIRLLPAPRFDAGPDLIPVEWDSLGKKVSFPLRLSLLNDSEALFEGITAKALLDGAEEIELGVLDPPSEKISHGNGQFDIHLQVNTEKLTTNRTYDLVLELTLANRLTPIPIDAARLGHHLRMRVVHPPHLQVLPEHGPLKFEVLEGTRKVKRFIEARNTGGGALEIDRISARAAFEEKYRGSLDNTVHFDESAVGIALRSGEKAKRFNLSISPPGVTDEDVQMKLKIEYSYQIDGVDYSKTYERDIILVSMSLKPGLFLAFDFGTTNTYCAAITDSLYNAPLEFKLDFAEEDGVVPSVIRYYSASEYGDVTIGLVPYTFYLMGYLNIFRSFKRRLGNLETYEIYPDRGGIERRTAEELITDYLRIMIDEAQNRLCRSFEMFVFTHPSLLSLPKLRAFQRVMRNLKIDEDEYFTIDEATASAIHFISTKSGNYKLLVYDFGGGTIDITYLLVRNDEKVIEVDVLDVGGAPDFGGDNVTEETRKICIDQLMKEPDQLLLPSDYENGNDFGHAEQARSNIQRLWNYSEELKKRIFAANLDGKKPLRSSIKLFFRESETGKINVLDAKNVDVTENQVNNKIIGYIADSVEIVKNFFEMDDKTDAEKQPGLPRYVLLSGRSSRIPLVKETFEAFKEGKRPTWDEEKREVVFVEDPENVSPMKFDGEVMFSDRLKASVALGAAEYLRRNLMGGRIKVRGLKSRLRSRVGLLAPGPGLDMIFDEWIPRNRRFVPADRRIGPETENPGSYAVAEREHVFMFRKEGSLFPPMDVYEHFGRDDAFNMHICSLLGKFSLKRPLECKKKLVTGKLRIYVTADFEVALEAKIEGDWIPCERI